ncbi:MAG: hypothetical protein GOMPHAMPRED_004588 [Gomphillus americanus]|uniref:Nucleotidyltransferase n=1 Tax=Gomphillus americanus TaxID=1940652 RepID=A0A8H3IV97_9LECA|nr:MAG: hypothetical protein GOMPHAMPRED_004588 [Gomphillus americanus]
MGGKAFGHHNPPLATPRMSSDLYYSLRDQYVGLLSQLFQYVASPMPGPGKTSHGDIDILVTAFHNESTTKVASFGSETLHNPAKEAIVDLLNPVGILHESETLNLALPHPELPNSYIQLDVHIVPTVRQWHWLLFTHSYGDAFNLICTSLHKLGLAGTDKGLFARDAEIEIHDGKKSRIFLTDDPTSVLTFLHLNPSDWLPAPNSQTYSPKQPFSSSTDLFHAISRMRYFSTNHFSRLRPSDRHRLGKRELYTTFMDTFLPAMLATMSTSESELRTSSTSMPKNPTFSREQVFHEALTYWNKEDEWRRIKMAWEYDRIALLSRRLIREEKKSAMATEDRYFDAWLAWSGFETGDY